MILISYPSGGFGNFLYHCLTEFASNTYKPCNSNFDFDLLGRSHSTKKYMPVYFHDPAEYAFVLPDSDLECLILCDNGINNDSYANINKIFPDAKIIRMVIDDAVRPVIYKTCTVKAQHSNTITETSQQVVANWVDSNENYAIRENFTLLYHNWPFKWHRDSQCINVSLEKFIVDPANTIENLIDQINGTTINHNQLLDLCRWWKSQNGQYFKIYQDWQRINAALDSALDIDLSDITDLHDQGYINYCIERRYDVIIPVYDYRDWFTSTRQIKEMIQCSK